MAGEIVLAFVSLGIGFLCIKNPAGVIRFQQIFYEHINWRLEPISLKKEIRNTRVMGFFLILVALATFGLIFA